MKEPFIHDKLTPMLPPDNFIQKAERLYSSGYLRALNRFLIRLHEDCGDKPLLKIFQQQPEILMKAYNYSYDNSKLTKQMREKILELCTALWLQLNNRHSFRMLLKVAKDDAAMFAKKIAKATVKDGEDIIFDLYSGEYGVDNIYTVWNYAKEHLSKRGANRIGSHV